MQIFSFIMMNRLKEEINLTKLYKSAPVRAAIWSILGPVFDEKFQHLMEQGEVSS